MSSSPDCDGKWAKAQLDGKTCMYLFLLLVPSLLMLKPGGYLYVGKLIGKCKHENFVTFLTVLGFGQDPQIVEVPLANGSVRTQPHVLIQKKATDTKDEEDLNRALEWLEESLNSARSHEVSIDEDRERQEAIMAEKEALEQVATVEVQNCWERQEGNLCGLHAVNVVLCVLKNGKKLTQDEFEFQMMHYAENELEYMPDVNPEQHFKMLYSGGYSIDALKRVLQKNGLMVEDKMKDTKDPIDEAFIESLHVARAIIVGTGGHWIALIKKTIEVDSRILEDLWFDVDSQEERVNLLGSIDEVTKFIQQNDMRGIIKVT